MTHYLSATLYALTFAYYIFNKSVHLKLKVRLSYIILLIEHMASSSYKVEGTVDESRGQRAMALVLKVHDIIRSAR